MPTFEALRRAQEQGLNLVEVSPDSRPPVCKILDYGKYKYDLKQDQKRRKRNQVVIELKELKFRVKVEKHDFDTKMRHVERFLAEGDKVKCTIMFRGRELAHTHLGEAVLQRVLAELGPKVIIEQTPKLEGRNMTMLLAPKPGAWPKPAKPKAAEDDKKGGEKKAGGKSDAAPVDEPEEPDEDEDDLDDEGDDDEGEDGET